MLPTRNYKEPKYLTQVSQLDELHMINYNIC